MYCRSEPPLNHRRALLVAWRRFQSFQEPALSPIERLKPFNRFALVLSALVNYRATCGTAKTVLGKFLKAESGVPTMGCRTTGDKLSGNDHVLKQPAFLALNQLAITRENAQGAGLFLDDNQA